MKTFYDILYSANYSDFDAWKYEMRQYFITSKVVNALDGIPQSTYYHPEFDALLHTFNMVYVTKMFGYDNLIEAAFLHDVGKAWKTTVGEKKIYSYGHAKKSVEFIEEYKDYIKYYDVTVKVIAEHMNHSIKNVSDYDKIQDEDLRRFVQMDKGQSRAAWATFATNFDLKKNKIKEMFVHFKQRHSSKKVYVMVGIPGSGKSRYLKNIDKKYIVCPDEIRREFTGNISNQAANDDVWEETKVRMKVDLLKYGKTYLDATSVDKWLRIEFMSDFNDCRKIAVVFEVDPEVAIRRIKDDIEKGIDRSNVPDGVVRKKYKLFEKGKRSLYNEFNKVVII